MKKIVTLTESVHFIQGSGVCRTIPAGTKGEVLSELCDPGSEQEYEVAFEGYPRTMWFYENEVEVLDPSL